MNKLSKNSGFTFIEVMVTGAIISLLAANIAAPRYMNHVATVKKNACAENRRVMEHAEVNYSLDKGSTPAVLQDLVSEGYVKKFPECPAEGIYAWGGENDHSEVLCSAHGAEEEEPTSLGPEYLGIMNNFLDLMNKYYEDNGSYPKGGWKKILKALGLDEKEWAKGKDGAKYRPGNKTLKVRVDRGYVFNVTSTSGKAIELTKGSVIYSFTNEKWYYNKVKSGNEVDINTLDIVEK